jgi:hypothetical protein
MAGYVLYFSKDVRFLVTLSGKSWKDFISNSSFYKDEMLSKINTLTPDQSAPLWNSGNGLCTSFAIFIATKIDSNFVYGDQGNHRAAFNKEGIIIDSSARRRFWQNQVRRS